MKIALYSDLHLEFCPWEFPGSEADTLVFAGDIGVGVQGVQWVKAVAEQNPEKHVIYVPGNHEYYGHSFDLRERLLDICSSVPNLSLLDHNEVLLRHDVAFFGGTMWTDLASLSVSQQKNVVRGMNDFRKIAGMDIATWTEEHKNFRKHLEMAAWFATDNSLPLVVISHHLPHEKSVPERFKGDPINGGFVQDMSEYFKPPISLWLHGHTHSSCDYIHNGVRVVCNPRGYYRHDLNPEFQENLIITV